jgi:hypothetical protein
MRPNHDLGEQVVGSRTVVELPRPMNIGPAHATMTFTLEGAHGEIQLLSEPMWRSTPIQKGSPLEMFLHEPIKIAFRPTRRGSYLGILTARAQFDDGSTWIGTTILRGDARAIDEAPSPSSEQQTARDAERRQAAEAHEVEARRLDEDSKIGEPYHQGNKNKLDDAAATAKDEALNVANAQRDGLAVAGAEADSFKKRSPPPSVWGFLAELAITMGVAGVAGVVAKALAGRIAGLISHNAASDSDSSLVHALAEGVQEGLQHAGASAVALARKPGAGVAPSSSNAAIAFFDKQRETLRKASEENKKMVNDRLMNLRPLLRTNPSLAIDGMHALAQSLANAKSEASRVQAHATGTQWAAFVARSALGSETTQDGDGVGVEVTRLRNHGTLPKDGVLDIHFVEGRVTRATLHGVSQATADQIAQRPLADARMPLRIVVGSGFQMGDWASHPALITRDEVGRVRVEHDLSKIPGHDGSPSEAQAIAAATDLLDRILAGPLPVRIETNDANRTTP